MGADMKRESGLFHGVLSFPANRRCDRESRLADSAQRKCWIPDRPHARSSRMTREKLAQ